ncbi:uncharacterized protein TNCT_292031 [Trichonephila clavata]|uniref:RAMA domain-containing protein n=1 Tax=Trichonephila clavata TaxID=2740835 RepID=A0A8X6K8A3_TRICU|nr:uncharacterized protein TNCT_292031 [Trichonephila clavata]
MKMAEVDHNETISNSESSDAIDERITYVDVCAKHFDSGVRSLEIPLLHKISAKKEMKSGINDASKTISSIRDSNENSKLSGNDEMDKYSEFEKNISCNNLVNDSNDEIISNSESSDPIDERITYVDICAKHFDSGVRSPEIPLLHKIFAKKEIKSGINDASKTISSIRDSNENSKLSGNDEMGKYSEFEKNVSCNNLVNDNNDKKILDSFITCDFTVDSKVLVDENLIENLIDKLNKDIPCSQRSEPNFRNIYGHFNKQQIEKNAGIRNPVKDTKTNEKVEEHYNINPSDNSCDIVAPNDAIVKEYSQHSLRHSTACSEDNFDCSQSLFLSPPSQTVLSENAYDSIFTQNTQSLFPSGSNGNLKNISHSQELFKTPLALSKDRKEETNFLNVESRHIIDTSFEESKNNISKFRANENDFAVCEDQNEIAKKNDISHGISADKQIFTPVSCSELILSDASTVTNCSNEKISNDSSKEERKRACINGSNDTCQINNQIEPDAFSELNSETYKKHQANFNHVHQSDKPNSSGIDQNDTFIEHLEMNSSSPSLLEKLNKDQKTDNVDINTEVNDLKLECRSSKFDYVKNIRINRSPMLKADLKNKIEISTEFLDTRSNEATDINMDDIGINDSCDNLQSNKEDNIKKFFKSNSTRCMTRFQAPWKITDVNEQNYQVMKKQENNSTLKNNIQVDNVKIQSDSNIGCENIEKKKLSTSVKFNPNYRKENIQNYEKYVEHATKNDSHINQSTNSETNVMDNNTEKELYKQIMPVNDMKEEEMKLTENGTLLCEEYEDTSDVNHEIIKVSNEGIKKRNLDYPHPSHESESGRCSKSQIDFSDTEQNESSNQSNKISLSQDISVEDYNEKRNSLLKRPVSSLNENHNTIAFRKRKRYNTRAYNQLPEKNKEDLFDTSKLDEESQTIEEFNFNSDFEILEEHMVKRGRKALRKRRNNIEVLEEHIVKRGRKALRERRKTSGKLDVVTISLPKNKRCKQKRTEITFDPNNHTTKENNSALKKEKFLLEKIETKLYKIASVIKGEQFSATNKNNALKLLQKMSSILWKTEKSCSNVKAKYENDSSNTILIPSKLKYLRFLYENLLIEAGNFSKFGKHKLNKKDCSELLHNSFPNYEINESALPKTKQKNTSSMLIDSKKLNTDNSIQSEQKVDNITRENVPESDNNYKKTQSKTEHYQELQSINTSDLNYLSATSRNTVIRTEKGRKIIEKLGVNCNDESETKIFLAQSQQKDNLSEIISFKKIRRMQDEQVTKEVSSEAIHSVMQHGDENESHCESTSCVMMEVNSSDETQSLADLNKSQQILSTEKENIDKITKPFMKECYNIIGEEVLEISKCTESTYSESVSLLENLPKNRYWRNKKHLTIPVTNVICQNNINSKFLQSSENNCLPNNETNFNHAISKGDSSIISLDSCASNEVIINKKASLMENVLLNSCNNTNNFQKGINDESLFDKQSDSAKIKSIKEKSIQASYFTNENTNSENNNCNFMNMNNSKNSEICDGFKKSLEIMQYSNVNDISDDCIPPSTAFSKKFSDINSLDKQDCTKNRNIKKFSSSFLNMCPDQILHGIPSQNESGLRKQQKYLHGNVLNPTTYFPSDTLDKCFDLNLDNISKNSPIIVNNNQMPVIYKTNSKSGTDVKKKITSSQTAKSRKIISLLELIRCNLLQPGKNVLSIQMPEGITLGSLESTGRITSNNKSYNTPFQWYCDILNFCQKAQKPSKSKSCYDRIYYQGRTLSYFANIYHEGPVNWNASQETEESSIMLGSSTGLEVMQRSIAPERDSPASPASPISDPLVLNLLKMKLMLIGDNEVGPIIETDQWDDIDKWE